MRTAWSIGVSQQDLTSKCALQLQHTTRQRNSELHGPSGRSRAAKPGTVAKSKAIEAIFEEFQGVFHGSCTTSFFNGNATLKGLVK